AARARGARRGRSRAALGDVPQLLRRHVGWLRRDLQRGPGLDRVVVGATPRRAVLLEAGRPARRREPRQGQPAERLGPEGIGGARVRRATQVAAGHSVTLAAPAQAAPRRRPRATPFMRRRRNGELALGLHVVVIVLGGYVLLALAQGTTLPPDLGVFLAEITG